MNLHAICRHGLLVIVLAACATLLMPAPSLRAQLQSSGDDDQPPPGNIELDMYAMLLSDQLFPGQISDGVWQISPGAGRFLIMVPFQINTGERPVELNRRTIDLEGPRARFIAWYFLPDEYDTLGPSDQGGGRGGDSAGRRIARGLDQRDAAAMDMGVGSLRDPSRDTRAARQMGGGPGMGGPGMDPAMGGGPGGFAGPGGGRGFGGGASGGGMPPAMQGPQSYEGMKQKPRFATDATITPGGTLQWEMERRIMSGELVPSGQLYPMKIDYRLLNEQNPDYQERQQSSSRRGSTRTPGGRGMPGGGAGDPGGGFEDPGGAGGGTAGRGGRGGRFGGGAGGGGGMDDAGGAGGGGAGSRFGGRTSQRNVQSREQREAERAQQEAQRIQRQISREQFQNLREQVRNLPDEFEEPMPRRVWAVYEMSQTADTFEIESDDYPHLNWSIDLQQLGILRQIAQQGIQTGQDRQGNAQLNAHNQQQLIQLGELANSNHRYSQRAVAQVLDLADLAYYTTMGDQLFFIFQTLLESEDAETRKIAQRELIQTFPPNQATRTLLQQVAESNLDPMEKLGAVRTFIEAGAQSIATDPAQAQQTINATNQVLADPNGPPPPAILEAMVAGVRDHPEAIDPLVDGIQFHRLTDERLHQALVFIVENAGREPLAAEWLDEKFLSATDPQIIRRALEVIVDAEAGAQSLGPVITWSLVKVLGSPANAEPAIKAKIAYKIPIDDLQHGQLRALRHGDGEIRDLAWQALPKFMMPPRDVFEDEQAFEAPTQDRYQVLLDAALEQSPTPTQIVPFLANQPSVIRRELASQQSNQHRQTRMGPARGGGGRRAQAPRGGAGFGDPGMDPAMMGGPGEFGGPGGPGMAGPGGRDGRGDQQRRLRTFEQGEMHPDVLRAVSSLVQVVLRGSSSASNAATRAMIGAEWPIDRALMDLEYGERQGFAMRTYDNLTGRVPWVTYTLRRRVERNPVVQWFGRQLAEGNLPDPGQWINAFGGDDELFELATATDGELAKGAVAVLVASAGGGDRRQQDVYNQVRSMTGATTQQVAELWETERRDIFLQRARRLEGTYRLVLRIGPRSEQVGDAPASGRARRNTGGGAPGALGGPPGADAGAIPPDADPGMAGVPGGPPGGPGMGAPAGGGRQRQQQADAPGPQTVQLPQQFHQEIILGQVQLRVSGQDVGFGNSNLGVKLHPRHFALMIESPADLANFDNDPVKDLPLEEASGPAILLPQSDGVWLGAFNLSEMGVYVFLEPETDV